MRMQKTIRGYLAMALIVGGWLCNEPLASGALANATATVDRINGTLTVSAIEVVDGVTQARGFLSAQATDSAGGSVNLMTNTAVMVPVILSGALATQAQGIDEYIPPPELSTNLCTILAISIEFVDVTIPGLGLNVHVNQLLVGVRADRETRLGSVLCNILGEEALGNPGGILSNTPNLGIRLQNNSVVINAIGPGILQSTPTLSQPQWQDVVALGSAPLTLTPTGPMGFFRIALQAMASRGAFSLGSINGVFTVSDFTAVNGSSLAAGWLSANVTDTTGANDVGTFTNFPVRVPVSGLLAGGPVEADFISDPVILPQLSTNTCAILGIVVGAIDVTVPGLGLNLHVNEISIVARADRETTIGNLLCTILGSNNNLLGGAPLASSVTVTASSMTELGAGTMLTVEQLRGLTDIVFEPRLPRGFELAGEPAGSGNKSDHPRKGLLQNLVHRVVKTMK